MNGAIVDGSRRRAGISLRTGCFCNPGAAEPAFRIPPSTPPPSGPRTSGDYVRAHGVQSGGAVRVSLGLPTTFQESTGSCASRRVLRRTSEKRMMGLEPTTPCMASDGEPLRLVADGFAMRVCAAS